MESLKVYNVTVTFVVLQWGRNCTENKQDSDYSVYYRCLYHYLLFVFFFFIERVKKVCKHLSPRWTFVSAEWEMLSGSPQCIYGLLYRCTYSVIQGMLGTHEANYQQLTSFQTHGQYHSKALIPHTHTNTHTGYGTNSYRDTRWIIENRQYVTLHLSIRV